MSGSRLVAVVLLAAAVAGACSGDQASSETTAPTDPPTTSATSTTTATTTTTVATSPTGVVTTGPPDGGSIAADVTAAAVESQEAYVYAVYHADAADAVARIELTHSVDGRARERALENLQMIIANGWEVRPNPSIPDSVSVESDAAEVSPDVWEVDLCLVGAGVVYAPATDGEPEIIVNEEVNATLSRVTMVSEDDRWKIDRGETIETRSGATTCAES